MNENKYRTKIMKEYPDMTKEALDLAVELHKGGMVVDFDDIWDSMSAEEQADIDSMATRMHMLDELKRMRKELGMTQTELAKKSGIPRPTISKIETGRRNVTVDTLTALAMAMGKRLELNFV